MKTFRQNAKYVLNLGVLLSVFSFIQWTGNGVSTGVAAANAQITDETIFSEESAVLDRNNPHVRRAMDIQGRYTRTLMEMPDVVGTATGLSEDNSPAILVFTKHEMKAGALPENLEGIPVTIKVTGEIFALREHINAVAGNVKPTSKFPMPVPIGVSTGNAGECSAGTIGARVKDAAGNVYALSNNHVYALENDAPIGSTILQPGLYDTRCRTGQSNVIGTLYDFKRIDFAGGDNVVDAAVASSSTAQLDNATPSGGYGKPDSLTYTQTTGNPPFIGQSVMKYGRTTRLTTGTINGINVTLSVCYNSACSLKAVFTDQIAVGSNSFSRAGDSGSLIVSNDANAYPIGLLFAGGGGITFANPIDAVLNSFKVSIDGK
jgi:hypothetical protein